MMDLARWFCMTLVAVLVGSAPLSVVAGKEQGPIPQGGADALTGSLDLTGSVALADLASLWADAFRQRHPLVRVTLADPGGKAGIDALINGTADVVLLGAPPGEIQGAAFEKRFGYPPKLFPVARDGVAVYVNTLNPLQRITLPELDAVFSSTQRCGERRSVTDWKELGVTDRTKFNRIVPYGLDTTTDAYKVFKRIALCGGDFRADFQAVAGPDAVESAVVSQPGAIGFSSSALRTAGARAVPVARDDRSPGVLPDADAIRSGRYPLGRTLLIAVNLPPEKQPSRVLAAFMDYVRSEDGQREAVKAGYVPY